MSKLEGSTTVMKLFDLELRKRWVTFSLYEKFEHLIISLLTVIIAMEFKHSLLVVVPHQRDIVQIRSVVLIALLALVRKFIILDIYQTQPLVVFALAAASLSLGVVFWLVRNQDEADSPKAPGDECD